MHDAAFIQAPPDDALGQALRASMRHSRSIPVSSPISLHMNTKSSVQMLPAALSRAHGAEELHDPATEGVRTGRHPPAAPASALAIQFPRVSCGCRPMRAWGRAPEQARPARTDAGWPTNHVARYISRIRARPATRCHVSQHLNEPLLPGSRTFSCMAGATTSARRPQPARRARRSAHQRRWCCAYLLRRYAIVGEPAEGIGVSQKYSTRFKIRFRRPPHVRIPHCSARARIMPPGCLRDGTGKSSGVNNELLSPG